MKEQQDNFTTQAAAYARYRPVYPQLLYEFLFLTCAHTNAAWDCGTGNGQVAAVLAQHFDNVYATDISEEQLAHAIQKPNILYSVERAELTSFAAHSFDLITVAQAIHWFDFDHFYREVNRTIKDGGLFAVIGYGLIQSDRETDAVINHFYQDIVGPYWDKERHYIDENYTTIPFPFDEIPVPVITNEFEWNLDDLLGYFGTWSAVQHCKNATGKDPILYIQPQLEGIWAPGVIKKVCFPVLLRAAIVHKTAK